MPVACQTAPSLPRHDSHGEIRLLVSYDERWAACRLCAPHVQRRHWARLADLVSRRRRDAGHPVTARRRAEMVALWLQLEQLLDDEA